MHRKEERIKVAAIRDTKGHLWSMVINGTKEQVEGDRGEEENNEAENSWRVNNGHRTMALTEQYSGGV